MRTRALCRAPRASPRPGEPGCTTVLLGGGGSFPRPSRSPPGRARGANKNASPMPGTWGTLPHAGITLYTPFLTTGHTHSHNPSRRGHSDPEFSRTRWNPRDTHEARTSTVLKVPWGGASWPHSTETRNRSSGQPHPASRAGPPDSRTSAPCLPRLQQLRQRRRE